MRIQNFNANGLVGKAEEIQRFAEANHIDICATLETWLSTTAKPPIAPVIANITQSNVGIIDGGRRNSAGILVSATSEVYQASSRLLHTALDGHATVINTNGVTFIFTYLPPSSNPRHALMSSWPWLTQQLGQRAASAS